MGPHHGVEVDAAEHAARYVEPAAELLLQIAYGRGVGTSVG